MTRKTIITILFFSIISFVAIGNKYKTFDIMNKEYLLENFNEAEYSNRWIYVRYSSQKKFHYYDEQELSRIKYEINNRYNEYVFIGLVRLKRFKIHNFSKDDKEKNVEEEAVVLQQFKGKKNKIIRYIISLETNDTYFDGLEGNKIVFLFEKNNILYCDQFLILNSDKRIIEFLQQKANDYFSNDSNIMP